MLTQNVLLQTPADATDGSAETSISPNVSESIPAMSPTYDDATPVRESHHGRDKSRSSPRDGRNPDSRRDRDEPASSPKPAIASKSAEVGAASILNESLPVLQRFGTRLTGATSLENHQLNKKWIIQTLNEMHKDGSITRLQTKMVKSIWEAHKRLLLAHTNGWLMTRVASGKTKTAENQP